MPLSGKITSNSLAGTATLLCGHRVALTQVHAINTTGAKAYIQLFDAATAASVTPGTTIPDHVLTVPASDSATDVFGSDGYVFESGVVAISTTSATGSSGAAAHVRLGHL